MEAVVTLVIMFRTGSFNKLIQKNFITKYEETGRYPAVLSRISVIEHDISNVTGIIDSYEDSWNRYLDIPMVSKQRLLYMKGFKAEPSFRGNMLTLDIGYMDKLEEHVDIVDGIDTDREIYAASESDVSKPEDIYPCYVSEYTADTYDLVPGERLKFNDIHTDSGHINDESYFTVYVSGIIREKTDDYYWNKSLYENGHMIYVDHEIFNNILNNNDIELAAYEIYDMADYRYINTSNVKRLEAVISQFHDIDNQFNENIIPVLTAYNHESRSLMAILYVIALPLVILVTVFIWMMAIRIVDSEISEIAGFSSRGIARSKIICIYIIQYLILCGTAFIPGILLGYIMGKMAAGVDDFLTFHIGGAATGTRVYSFTWQMIPVGVLALFIALFVMVIPVIFRSDITLVDHHNRRVKVSEVPFWERYFIDLILLALSLYLLHNYNKQLPFISEAVLNGEGIDPMIFVDAILFLVAAGLCILRVIFYVIKLIYRVCGRHLKPSGYAGILQIIRTRKRSGIVSVFMVVTVAMSLYNANMARTINANNEARLRLDIGSDYIIREHFEMKIKGQKPPQTWKYIEPDPSIYNDIVSGLGMDGFTKVIRDDETEVRNGPRVVKSVTLMGINTKEFGNVANMKEDEGEKHWYYYLNDMGASSNGCIISKNLADELEIGVGDTFTYSRIAPVDSVGIYASATGCVAAIVDVWPGYEKYKYSYNEDGRLVCEENYLVAANYASVVNTFGITPYEIWMSGNSVEVNGSQKAYELKNAIEHIMEGTTRHLESVESTEKNLWDMKGSALIQITNGLFTVDFLIALILCVLGFMIYWISTIRDRELLFGIYRAMGISVLEIEKMLFIEQFFLTLVSIIAGVASGGVATVLFGRLFAIVYLPKKHSIPLENIIAMQDIIKLFVVLGISVVLCMVIIRKIVKRLNITEALKLGED